MFGGRAKWREKLITDVLVQARIVQEEKEKLLRTRTTVVSVRLLTCMF
jgi:hypothetical protein